LVRLLLWFSRGKFAGPSGPLRDDRATITDQQEKMRA